MSTAIDLTSVNAQLFDTKRQLLRGTGEVLKIIRLKPGKVVDGGGYKVLKTITSGWNPKRVTRRGNNQFFEIKIADVDGTFRKLIEEGPDVPTHCAIQKPGDDYATLYEKRGVDQPEKATQVWLIRCAPTGERKKL